ncbi:MAG: pyridoxal-phosphate dependent enzyme [Candidatus Odinarchaeota archaeon]|nr:pyridoxal-phosphate dependent enzyme [Candidatus Odinarchaeota archaeon]
MFYMKCYNCEYEIPEINYENFICPKCGKLMFYSLEKKDLAYLREKMLNLISSRKISSIWSFRDFFPVKRVSSISLGEGNTPFIHANNLKKQLNVTHLFLKDETKNPTNSFRDRAASLIVSVAKKLKYSKIVCSTNGNMGASIAAYASKARLESIIVVPRNVDYGKLAQIIAFGGNVITHGDSVDDTFDFAKKIAIERKAYNATPEFNALAIEGQKTISYEIYMQLGSIPDIMIVPTGSGSSLVSLWKGFRELKILGIIDNMPKFVIAQPSKCSPIVSKFHSGETTESLGPTSALGLYVKKPLFIDLVIKILRETKGLAVSVEEKNIFEAEKMLAKHEAIFAEPASAVGIASIKLLKEIGIIEGDEKIVALVTGSGLKASYILDAFVSKRSQKTIYPKVSTKIEILRFLTFGPSYGYEIWKKVKPDLKFQAIYQHLQELREKGLVDETTKDRRKYYKITEKGKRLLEAFEEITLLL